MRRVGLSFAALAAGLLAAAPAMAAHAHHHTALPPMPWVGIYTLGASGEQTTNWTLDHEPANTCDQQEKGNGSETDAFPTSNQGQVFVTGVGPHVLSLAPEFASITVQIQMNRNGSITPGPEPPSECAVGSGEGGGPPPVPDCGFRTGQMELGIVSAGATSLRVQPFEEGEFAMTPIDDEHEPQYPYNDCPNLGSILPEGLQQTDVLFPPTAAVLPGAPPGLEGPASLDGEGANLVPLTESPEVTGLTHTSFRLHLVRLAGLAEVKATSAKVAIGAGGTGSLGLHCPKQVAKCSGNAFLAVDFSGESETVHRFPAPALSESRSLGQTSFALKGGQSGRVQLRIGHVTPSFLHALRGLGLYAGVKLGTGKHAVRYLVAPAHIS